MSAALIGLATALPQLLELLKQAGIGASKLWEWLNHVSGNDPVGYLVKVGQAFSQLNEAKTQDEHSKAAKSIADLIRGFPA